MTLVWTPYKGSKRSRTAVVKGEYGDRFFWAEAQTSGKAGFVVGWTIRELDSIDGFCIAVLASEVLVRDFNAIVEEHLYKYPYTLEQAVDFACENEALELHGEDKLNAEQCAFNNASVYADQYGFTLKAFQRKLMEKGAR